MDVTETAVSSYEGNKTIHYTKEPKPDFIQKHTLFQWDAYIHICKYLLFIYTQGGEKIVSH